MRHVWLGIHSTNFLSLQAQPLVPMAASIAPTLGISPCTSSPVGLTMGCVVSEDTLGIGEGDRGQLEETLPSLTLPSPLLRLL